MARIIFLATVLVALCYTSQALPTMPELKEGAIERLKDNIGKIQDLINKLREANQPDRATLAFGWFPGLPIIKEIKDTITNILDETGSLIEEITNSGASQILDAAGNVIDKVADGTKHIGNAALDGAGNIIGGVGKNVNDLLSTPKKILGGNSNKETPQEPEDTNTDKPTEEAQVASLALDLNDVKNNIQEKGKDLKEKWENWSNALLDQLNKLKDEVQNRLDEAFIR